MKYISVCSGIEAATVAWHPLGWEPVAFSEIEPFPSKVLAHHYPIVPNLGDMTKFKEWPNYANVDVLVGGTPCQSFSIAGLRKGLDDPRGNLMLTYLAIADKYRPTWVVWENVPGVLSSNGGRDFGTFLGGLGQLGYGFAYRVLDAQYTRTDRHPYAVPQRRRRVFVVGHIGSWQRAAAVLFDTESLRGNPPPSREAGKAVAGTITRRTGISRNNHEDCVAQTLLKRDGGFDLDTETAIIDDRRTASGNPPPSRKTREEIAGDATQSVERGCRTMTFDRQSSGEYGTAQVASTMAQRDYKSVSDIVALAGNTIGRKTENGGHNIVGDVATAITPVSDCLYAAYGTKWNGNGAATNGSLFALDSAPTATAFKVRGGCEGGGKGYLGSDETAFTLSTTHDQGTKQWLGNQEALSGDCHVFDVSKNAIGFNAEARPDEMKFSDTSASLTRSQHSAVAIAGNTIGRKPENGGNGPGYDESGVSSTLTKTDVHAVATAFKVRGGCEGGGKGYLGSDETEFTLSTTHDQDIFMPHMQVRRLTPMECERLQGFPDGYTDIPGASDTTRYKALGNSMAVNVMQAIGQRIQMVSEIPLSVERAA